MRHQEQDGSPSNGSEPRRDAELNAELEEVWQQESPDTARRTEFADEVDGELGTRAPGRTGDAA
ncbi:hypothetical protein [Leucobacter triazinivorans]|uniref:Uncharacterized protein n=1 Tax=Leucobacter triazinivorans TaxID=1784719 RepID=A0A4P6KIG4_9MICO|nr:hypothetical protein [Leucobacter triazinivorans]QBE49788.1 hypothetical protein EVS81_13925 [Leucobacter triazinivorans]